MPKPIYIYLGILLTSKKKTRSIMKERAFFTIIAFVVICSSLASQTHVSVPVERPIYNILEQAQIKGLIGTLPAVKPYSQRFIVESIEKILSTSSDRLSLSERRILERELERYRPRRVEGRIDWTKGSYSFTTHTPKAGTRLSFETGAALQMTMAGAYYDNDMGIFWGMENLGKGYLAGDIGENISYDFNLSAALVRAPRLELGTGWTYYGDFNNSESWPDAFNKEIIVHGQPLTYFPYTFRRNWGGGYFLTVDNLSEGGFIEWPNTMGVGPYIISELSGSALDNTLYLRFGRIRREWAAMSGGQSLTLNSMAQPFVALEAEFRPVSWFGFSAMTGALEYLPAKGDMFTEAWGSQTLFSIEQLELNYKEYFHFGFGTTAVWDKRFELGYIFPLIPNFINKAAIGGFDNTALFMNLRGQIPGLGMLWFSVFVDDIIPDTLRDGTFWEQNWNQYAYQVGTNIAIPWFGSFTNFLFSYTKIEPYNYTHRRMFTPWHNSNYGDQTLPLANAYVNYGVSLGHYLPPNSDEFLFRVETMPAINSTLHFQFQLIRHGAAHGSSAVDGSHLLSEFDPSDRRGNPVLRKFFLRDGAYQWMYIPKIGGSHTLLISDKPITFFADVGMVFSYYTNINGEPNSGRAYSFSRINTSEYPASAGFIANIGFRVFW